MAIDQLSELPQQFLWERDWDDAPAWQRAGISALRTVVLVVRDLIDGELNLRAMSLVYTTLLSMVPLLALSFSLLKGFGVQNRLDETLKTALEPLGEEKAAQLAESLIGFVNNMNVGVLGAVGLLFLVYTVISLTQKIESAFNYAWRISLPRSFGDRFTTFLSAITIGPLLVFAALAATGSAMNTELMSRLHEVVLIGSAMDLVAKLLPFALIIAAFSFLYATIPNTRVRIGAALTGGLVAGVMWEVLSFGFASYASGTSNYQLVYATFATAIFFMIWLYLNWLILLIGASIAFYRQYPELVATGLQEVHFNPAQTSRYALSILARVGRRFYASEPGYTLEVLAPEYRLPSHALSPCLRLLVDTGLLVTTDETERVYMPGVPFDTMTVDEVLSRVNRFQPSATYQPPKLVEAEIDAIDSALSESQARSLGGLTLKQLAFDAVSADAEDAVDVKDVEAVEILESDEPTGDDTADHV